MPELTLADEKRLRQHIEAGARTDLMVTAPTTIPLLLDALTAAREDRDAWRRKALDRAVEVADANARARRAEDAAQAQAEAFEEAAQIEAVRELHRRAEHGFYGPICTTCEWDDGPRRWPCPTARALGVEG